MMVTPLTPTSYSAERTTTQAETCEKKTRNQNLRDRVRPREDTLSRFIFQTMTQTTDSLNSNEGNTPLNHEN